MIGEAAAAAVDKRHAVDFIGAQRLRKLRQQAIDAAQRQLFRPRGRHRRLAGKRHVGGGAQIVILSTVERQQPALAVADRAIAEPRQRQAFGDGDAKRLHGNRLPLRRFRGRRRHYRPAPSFR